MKGVKEKDRGKKVEQSVLGSVEWVLAWPRAISIRFPSPASIIPRFVGSLTTQPVYEVE